ncbi:HEAT repeat-containing protein [Paenibacillus uliginis N3/975]|uniref:HEAT repeat-containing protein n=1 Tax=Paenibacillus uliginis N3/975 TaxID=1313296 RepID=A0A1X7HQE5_9BACL|nr:HEAT repeat domain-containing protein [Paenibacillus uliginis]SMF90060.1 HEAT repeat-containing protein [Paenibacillus uliginis N3/975]
MDTEQQVQGEKNENSYKELKAAANRTADWRERLKAVEELGKIDNPQALDVLKHRMMNDPVYKVQEAAYQQLKEVGEDVQMPPRRQEELVKGLTKMLVRIKKSLPAGHSYEEFKEKLKKMRIDVYDTYEGDKGEEFDKWLEDKWASLRTSQQKGV